MRRSRRTRKSGHSIGRLGIGLVVMLLSVAPDLASAQMLMSVDGPKGPFAAHLRVGNRIKILNVAADFAPGATSTVAGFDARSALKPVLVTKPIDRTSGEFLDALASNDALNVVISIVQTSTSDGMPMRRVLTLWNARVSAVHDAIDIKSGAPLGLGFETITFTYDRIDVDDDGVRVFSAGGS